MRKVCTQKRLIDSLNSYEKTPSVDETVEAIDYIYQESHRLAKSLASNYGLTGRQLAVAKALEAEGPMSLTTLSTRIRAQNSTVTGIIDRMEREGLVARVRSFHDRRVVHIKLTDKGVKLVKRIELDPSAFLKRALNALKPEEHAELNRVLSKLADNLCPEPGSGLGQDASQP